MTTPYSDILSYGKHAPLGNTLDVPEERNPPDDYVGVHALTTDRNTES